MQNKCLFPRRFIRNLQQDNSQFVSLNSVSKVKITTETREVKKVQELQANVHFNKGWFARFRFFPFMNVAQNRSHFYLLWPYLHIHLFFKMLFTINTRSLRPLVPGLSVPVGLGDSGLAAGSLLLRLPVHTDPGGLPVRSLRRQYLPGFGRAGHCCPHPAHPSGRPDGVLLAVCPASVGGLRRGERVLSRRRQAVWGAVVCLCVVSVSLKTTHLNLTDINLLINLADVGHDWG